MYHAPIVDCRFRMSSIICDIWPISARLQVMPLQHWLVQSLDWLCRDDLQVMQYSETSNLRPAILSSVEVVILKQTTAIGYRKGVQNYVLCWEVVPFLEGPLSEVPLYTTSRSKSKPSWQFHFHCSRILHSSKPDSFSIPVVYFKFSEKRYGG